MACGRPHRFLHNNFCSVCQIFTKLDHMISLWKGKNPIYFGVIRSKVKVTVTINRIFDNGSFPHNFSSEHWIFTKLDHMIPLWKGKNPIYFGSLGQRSLLLLIQFLTTLSFPHDNFSSVYWIFNKLDHMIPLWKGKNSIYFGVITIIPFDNLYRRAYFVMHTFLV